MAEKFNIDAPQCTASEADTLFYHHLMMACTYFEILPDDHEFNTLIFDRAGRQSVWLDFARISTTSFIESIKRWRIADAERS
jgi:hypothetical protein